VIEKLVEDAIVAAWRHLPDLDNPSDFPAWFRRIGANLALVWYREHQDEPLSEPFPAKRCGHDPKVTDAMNRVELVLGELTDAQRMALEQHYRGGMRAETLAESLHLDLAATQKLLDEALQAFDRALQNDRGR
jgi:DNA-directed RNA polymerase specialized sigma24 family protein